MIDILADCVARTGWCKDKRCDVDAGFFGVEMIDFLKGELEKNNPNYLIRMPINRKIKRMKLWEGRRFTYSLEDKKRISSLLSVSQSLVPYLRVIRQRDKQKKDGKDFCVYLFTTSFVYDSQTILELYKDRWATETGYRMY